MDEFVLSFVFGWFDFANLANFIILSSTWQNASMISVPCKMTVTVPTGIMYPPVVKSYNGRSTICRSFAVYIDFGIGYLFASDVGLPMGKKKIIYMIYIYIYG